VTNVTFIFETSPNTKPKEEKVGDMAYYTPTVWKSMGNTSPVSPTKLRPWCHTQWCKTLKQGQEHKWLAQRDVMRASSVLHRFITWASAS